MSMSNSPQNVWIFFFSPRNLLKYMTGKKIEWIMTLYICKCVTESFCQRTWHSLSTIDFLIKMILDPEHRKNILTYLVGQLPLASRSSIFKISPEGISWVNNSWVLTYFGHYFKSYSSKVHIIFWSLPGS